MTFRFLTLSELEQTLPLKEASLRSGFEVGMLILNGDYIELGYPDWLDVEDSRVRPPRRMKGPGTNALRAFKYPQDWLSLVSQQRIEQPIQETGWYRIGQSGVFTGIEVEGVPVFVLSRGERDNLWFMKMSDCLDLLKKKGNVLLDSIDCLHWDKHTSPFKQSFPILFEHLSQWLTGEGLPDALVGLNAKTEEITQERLRALPQAQTYKLGPPRI